MRKAGDVCFAEVSRDSEGITSAGSRDKTLKFVCRIVIILIVKCFPSHLILLMVISYLNGC